MGVEAVELQTVGNKSIYIRGNRLDWGRGRGGEDTDAYGYGCEEQTFHRSDNLAKSEHNFLTILCLRTVVVANLLPTKVIDKNVHDVWPLSPSSILIIGNSR